MTRLLFLDVDGVLNHETYYMERPVGDDRPYPLSEFDPACVDRVNRILGETGACLVVSSSWRLDGCERLSAIFGAVGLPTEFGVTPLLPGRPRGEEIAAYMEDNPCDSYAILDDDTDMLDCQMDNFVWCHYYTGLTDARADKAVRILLGNK